MRLPDRAAHTAALAAVALLNAGPVPSGQSGLAELRTRAEATNYQETSRYADVMAFLAAADAASPLLHVNTFGYSFEGRPLPLAVVGRVADAGAAAVRATGRLRVYIQANVHGGEVDGKEAMLALVRELAAGAHPEWLDRMVLLIAPIYNADGNERVTLGSRPLQHGPVGGAGQRANAQGLNINRDYVKLETPEARAMVKLLNEYDPHVMIDLHTTNGTRHAYHLTFETPNHPAVFAPIVDFARGQWMPQVVRQVKERFGWDVRSYGNVEGAGDDRSWTTVEDLPRYSHNYWGMRNRFGILSESYSYAAFEDRIVATQRFAGAALDLARERADDIIALTQSAQTARLVGEQLAVRSAPRRSLERVPVLMGEVAEVVNPFSGRPMLRRLDIRRPELMWERVVFDATERERVPASYFVPRELRLVVERLQAHGVRVEPVATPETHEAEVFRVAATTLAERAFENHRERSVNGTWTAGRQTIPAGSWRVPMDQPLARLAFILLEPRSSDSLLTWNLLDDALAGRDLYPILRSRN